MGTSFSRSLKKDPVDAGRLVSKEDKVFQTENKAGTVRNFVLLDIPPNYDLTLDSTDSEITELEYKFRRQSSSPSVEVTQVKQNQQKQNKQQKPKVIRSRTSSREVLKRSYFSSHQEVGTSIEVKPGTEGTESVPEPEEEEEEEEEEYFGESSEVFQERESIVEYLLKSHNNFNQVEEEVPPEEEFVKGTEEIGGEETPPAPPVRKSSQTLPTVQLTHKSSQEQQQRLSQQQQQRLSQQQQQQQRLSQQQQQQRLSQQQRPQQQQQGSQQQQQQQRRSKQQQQQRFQQQQQRPQQQPYQQQQQEPERVGEEIQFEEGEEEEEGNQKNYNYNNYNYDQENENYNEEEEEEGQEEEVVVHKQLESILKHEKILQIKEDPEPIVTERTEDSAETTAQSRDIHLESDIGATSQNYTSELSEDQSCDCYCDCDFNCTCVCDCEFTTSSSCICDSKDAFSSEERSHSDPNGVMPDYQRYSREAPEKDQADRTTMKECCRPSHSRNAQSKRNATQNSNNLPNCNPNQNPNSNNRHLSDSYVSCRNLCSAPPARTTPLNTQSNPHFEAYPAPPPPRRLHGGEQRQIPPRKGTPQAPQRTYPPGRREPERPHIPLPPPFHCTPQANLVPEPRSEENMYSHNTKRNYVSNKPYKPTHSYHRQPIKPYPYEEPGGSTTYSNESTCSNNCSGYDHCPMHQICKCQCLCGPDREDRFPNCGTHPPHEDEMSCCSDSSNSEYMNLAYQRTGDYPELMDELENTLSYRNRLRVQKTMQRFEMLSRQNKNLEKPIFEDEESMHYLSGRRHKHHDHSECKCPHCEERARRQQYPTRNETLSKRANYQPTPFPRNAGYVEKVARYMDPNLNFQRRNSHNGHKSNGRSGNQELVTNSTGTWQMDPRKGEWVKVHPNSHNNGNNGGQNQYDFENNYPPLPPRPGSNNMYERRNYGHERGHCACPKCARRLR